MKDRPSIAELWEQAAGDQDRFDDLMLEYGWIKEKRPRIERTEPYTQAEVLDQIHHRHLCVLSPETGKRESLLMTYVMTMGVARHQESGEYHLLAYTALGREFIVDVPPFPDEASALAFGQECAEAAQNMKPAPEPLDLFGRLN